jgi:4-amino-4-deoxychorismate lyase
VILVDGRRSSTISALDRGLAYGDGVFRTMLATAGRIAFWPRHYRKLARDCAVLGIECPKADILGADLSKILRFDPDCVAKIIVTRGRGGRGYAVPDLSEPTRVVASFPLPAPRMGCEERGVRVRWCQTRLATQSSLAGVKHLNRLENVLARREWCDADIAEGLMLDQSGHVIAGTFTNVFIIEGSALVTPSLDGCGVAGVQRERLMAGAGAIGMSCTEERLSPERTLESDQVLLVNSVVGLWWANELGERRWRRSDPTVEIMRLLARSDD